MVVIRGAPELVKPFGIPVFSWQYSNIWGSFAEDRNQNSSAEMLD